MKRILFELKQFDLWQQQRLNITKYEVLKTRTGTELVGMTRDIGDVLSGCWSPMICHLSLIPNSQKTQVVFYAYSPLF